MGGPGGVQVIENRVKIECLVTDSELNKSNPIHGSYTIQILHISPISGYPDLVSNQNLAELELIIRIEEILSVGDLKGRRISCEVAWAPRNRIFAIKGTLKILE
jgi:hypothetical protein